MAMPRSAVYVDAVLTQLSIAYQPQDFIADRLFPRITNLSKPTGIYYEFGKEKFGPYPNTLRAPGTRAREVEWKLTKKQYETQPYALLGKVTEEDRKAQDAPVELDQNTVENTTELILLDRELRVKSLVTNTANYDPAHVITNAAGNEWNGGTPSSPYDQIEQAKEILRSKGIVANTVLLSSDAYQAAKKHADVKDSIKYTQAAGPGNITPSLLAQLFGVQTVLVGGSIYNTANAGQTPNLVDLWEDYAWVGYVAPRPGLRQMTFGYTFEHQARQVRRWYEADKRTDFFEVSEEVDERIVAPDAGVLIVNAA